MKKIFTIMLIVLMVFTMTSCGKEKKSEKIRYDACPVSDVESSEELAEETELKIDAPEGAKNVSYEYYHISKNDGVLYPYARVRFKYKGRRFWYIASKTTKFEYTTSNANKLKREAIDAANGLCSFDYKWVTEDIVNLDNGCVGFVGYNEGYAGLVTWYNDVEEVLYCVCMDYKCTLDKLTQTANAIYESKNASTDN